MLSEQTHSLTHLSLSLLETGTCIPSPSFRLHNIIFNFSRTAFTDTFISDPIPEISSFHDPRVHSGHRCLYLFDATSSCINIITKNLPLSCEIQRYTGTLQCMLTTIAEVWAYVHSSTLKQSGRFHFGSISIFFSQLWISKDK